MKRIIFTVTNDLCYDQRMQRICASLAANGFDVTLAGRKLVQSPHLTPQAYHQKRLFCLFTKGILFYAEYNLRLFFWLLFQPVDIICAIDLDTILPCYAVSALRRKKRVYDAHELFTEQKEIVTRPFIHKYWLLIEKFTVPKFSLGYTVNQFIADELYRRYQVQYGIVRNMPVLYDIAGFENKKQSGYIIYQGAVNEGRSFETLIPAMQQVNAQLHIYGKGNFFEAAEQLIIKYSLQDKVILHGYVLPKDLKNITPTASIAVTLFEQTGLNQYYSLSNRFFDYIMAGVPQVCVNYPEYKIINDVYDIALMINDTTSSTIANALNTLLNDAALYKHLQHNCVTNRKHLSWQQEEKYLLDFYHAC
ncbi:glycosyltransferase family 4 protein [Limnovirga soli]|nr:glycosyltransferase family 4 protein [Limnovirga soli]